VLVPVLIFVVLLSVGAFAGSRWLPDLAAGQVGGLAFFLVCGLIGAGLGILGIHIYLIVEEVRHASLGGYPKGVFVAAGIRAMVFEAGSVFGLAGIVYLLAPCPPEVDDELELEPAG
jgi:hypothetical protein